MSRRDPYVNSVDPEETMIMEPIPSQPAAAAAAAAPTRVVKVVRPQPAVWIDGRAVVIALLLAAPALYHSRQGLLSGTDALARLGLITVGCLAASVVVRMLWPVVVGDPPTSARPSLETAPASAPAAETLDMGYPDLDGLDDLGLDPVSG